MLALCWTTNRALDFVPANEPVALLVPPEPGNVTVIGVPIATEAFEKPSLVGVAPGELAVQVMVIDGAMELSEVQLAVA